MSRTELSKLEARIELHMSIYRMGILECIRDFSAMVTGDGYDPKVVSEVLHEARKKLQESLRVSPKLGDMAAQHAALIARREAEAS